MTPAPLLDLRDAVAQLARTRNLPLAPTWAAELATAGSPDAAPADWTGGDALARLTARLSWPAAVRIDARPRPDEFPLLVHDQRHGWAVADQWEHDASIRLAGTAASLPYAADQAFFDLALPDPLRGSETPSAIAIFWRAIMRRKHVIGMAAVATVFANILALVTSLYSMQVYDRVIPLGSYDTLVVLTIGVAVALLLDFVLRVLRAVMIEREAAEIDAEVSEYFFARSQAVRLDARPPGVGTMAAQLRGLEQVRAVMSSASLFMIADLPFALLFILVIAYIGGAVAIVPIISLPIALAIALLLARMIRKGTDRAQVSGNRKNGMLVEALDAAESIKANQGGWFMLGRWNRLVREVHHHEDPVKRTSAIAASVFQLLQQAAYVAVMAVGAVAVGAGDLTAGGLLACSIIAGRINGPLVAMLPNLIVQWGYARSSLRALDGILALPLDRPAGSARLRPSALTPPLRAEGVRFAYPGAREMIDVPALTINAGERVAIIGGIGSGKTTLLRLLAGLYRPQAGSITIGGLDLDQVAEDIVRARIGYLPQDVRLVNGSLRDNLSIGLGHVTDDDILAVATRTGLNALIAGHPQGLDLQIKEGGTGLSGGQRSLVGLNRLLLGRPGILLLDEPTANLDQASERAMFGALDETVGAQGTLVMVTHRLQLLPRFQRVIVMTGGRIVSDGPAADMLARPPRPLRAAAAAPPPGTITTAIPR
ncbi:ATP-binding cassette domain-containing protein [Polymorphobacter sp.]|uniref:ATP-binding cassette domain-containing protein n=1 Tax=Polymorphobacter sp. TaxID=1909290 RepID=UPI003F702B1F